MNNITLQIRHALCVFVCIAVLRWRILIAADKTLKKCLDFISQVTKIN